MVAVPDHQGGPGGQERNGTKMTGREVAIKGRELSLKDPVAGRPIAVDIDAEGLTLELTTTAGLDRPTIRLHAAADIIERTVQSFDGDTWTVRLPRDGRSYGGSGTTVISAGSLQVNNFSSFSGSSGRVVIDGVDMTDIIRERKAAAAAQMPRAVVQVPSGSVLVACVDSGSITTTGDIRAVQVTTTTASLRLGDGVREAHFSTSTGSFTSGSVGRVKAKAMSGSITVRGGTAEVSASTMSGDVDILMMAAAMVMARTMSGDVTVRSAPGISLAGLVMADSMSGSVRAPQ
jgi:Toastrack DUF4097